MEELFSQLEKNASDLCTLGTAENAVSFDHENDTVQE